MNNGIAVHVISSLDEVPGGQDAWHELVLSSPRAGVFQTYQWHQAWLSTVGSGVTPRIVVAERNCRLVGVAPLCQVIASHGVRLLEFIGTANRASDYADSIVAGDDPAVFEALATKVVSLCISDADEVSLFNLPESSPFLSALLRCAEAQNIPHLQRRLYDAPARDLSSPAHNQEFRKKKSLRRHVNGFERESPLVFRVLERAEFESHLPAFFAQHRGRRALAGSRSGFELPSEMEMFRSLAHRLSDSGLLHFSALEWQGRVIAYHFGFLFKGVLTWYKPSFDADLAKRSPGEALLMKLFEDALQRGARELDFTVGNEGFKYRFATVIRGNVELRLIRSRFRASSIRAARAVRALGARVYKAMRRAR